jgi:hypothetical protein
LKLAMEDAAFAPALSTNIQQVDQILGDDAAYTAANQAIIREAESLGRATLDSTRFRLVAVIVWEGSARAETDASGRHPDLSDESRIRGAFRTDKVNNTLIKDTMGCARVSRKRREVLLDEFERGGTSGTQFADYVGARSPKFANF